jgi:hypothetical protein
MNGPSSNSAYTQTEKPQETGRRHASPLRSTSFQGHDPTSLRRIEAEVKSLLLVVPKKYGLATVWRNELAVSSA